ncbi:MAG: hypothetical protein ACM3SV_12370 [Betaproteobacteria bacterium]
MKTRSLVLGSTLAMTLSAGGAFAAMDQVRSATAAGNFGLQPASDFRLTDGKCADCPNEKAALWYFRDDTIAVPQKNAAGFERGSRTFDDVRRWAKANPSSGPKSYPPLLWVGSQQVVNGARLSDDGKRLTLPDGKALPFALTPKIDSNRSFFDASSQKFFAGRELNIRGKTENGQFVGRTLWPADFALDYSKLPYQPLQSGESLDGLVRANEGGARLPMAARVLWQRDPKSARAWADKPVLAFVLNGAQGDDDEAHGGHFAVATGRFGAKGEWGDWTVNNFYNLDSISEKGIVASSLPLDAYQGDLNSGQSWYRPSYLVVAVLKQDRAAAQYQDAINRVFNHFYRHDFVYRHASANCAGLNMETLRTIGWQIPLQGPTSRAKAIAALPFMSIKERSLENGMKATDYLMAEQTDLYPMVAFQAAGNDLLSRLAQGRAETAYEKMLAEDLEGLVFIRLPQFPSSRAFGQAPVASIDEYIKRAPEDRAQWKMVPTQPRPFPEEFKDAQSPSSELLPSTLTLYGYGGFFGLAALGIVRRRWRKQSSNLS